MSDEMKMWLSDGVVTIGGAAIASLIGGWVAGAIYLVAFFIGRIHDTPPPPELSWYPEPPFPDGKP